MEVIVVKDNADDQDYNKIKFAPGQMVEQIDQPPKQIEDSIDRSTIVGLAPNNIEVEVIRE